MWGVLKMVMELEPDKILAMINVVFLLIFAYVVGYKWRRDRAYYKDVIEVLEANIQSQARSINGHLGTLVQVKTSNDNLTKTVTGLINSVDTLVQVLDTANTDDNERGAT